MRFFDLSRGRFRGLSALSLDTHFPALGTLCRLCLQYYFLNYNEQARGDQTSLMNNGNIGLFSASLPLFLGIKAIFPHPNTFSPLGLDLKARKKQKTPKTPLFASLENLSNAINPCRGYTIVTRAQSRRLCFFFFFMLKTSPSSAPRRSAGRCRPCRGVCRGSS